MGSQDSQVELPMVLARFLLDLPVDQRSGSELANRKYNDMQLLLVLVAREF